MKIDVKLKNVTFQASNIFSLLGMLDFSSTVKLDTMESHGWIYILVLHELLHDSEFSKVIRSGDLSFVTEEATLRVLTEYMTKGVDPRAIFAQNKSCIVQNLFDGKDAVEKWSPYVERIMPVCSKMTRTLKAESSRIASELLSAYPTKQVSVVNSAGAMVALESQADAFKMMLEKEDLVVYTEIGAAKSSYILWTAFFIVISMVSINPKYADESVSQLEAVLPKMVGEVPLKPLAAVASELLSFPDGAVNCAIALAVRASKDAVKKSYN
jgi:hypothetical protein